MSKFWNGSVKLTYNTNREPKNHSDVVKFKDLITGPWNFILLSAYCTDFDWLLNQFEGIAPDVPINIVEHYDRNSEKAGIQSVSVKSGLSGNKRTLNLIHPSFPKFPSYGVMHCKLMILAADDYLRIVVSSANLLDYDYEEVQNIVFVQDLPRLRETSMTASTCSFLLNSQFYKSLNKLLELMGVFHEDKVIMPMDLMQKYDWTRVKANLVYSTPTYCRVDEEKNVSGLVMLNEICKAEPFYTKNLDEIIFEYQGSSLGTMNQSWLDSFIKAASGNLFSTSKSTTTTSVPSGIKRSFEDDSVIDLTDDNSEQKHKEVQSEKIKIIFPTLKTVLNSRCGSDGFGTLFCKKKDFLSPNFPSNHFYDCTTVKSSASAEKCRYSMHSKIMTISTVSSASATKSKYVYCGSHNFTASAWGKLTKNDTMLMVSNFEVGVVLPAELWNCEYPYVRPPPKYSESDLPWDQIDHRNN